MMEPSTPREDPRHPPVAPPAEDEQDEQQERRARRRGLLLVTAGLTLAASAALAAVYGPTLWRIVQQRDATLTLPAEAAGLRLDDSDRARSTADYLRTTLSAGLSLDRTVAGVYADPAGPARSVILVGGTATLRDPERELEAAFRLLTDGGDVDTPHPVPAGELGGVMKCGTSRDADVAMAVCGWADHGTVVIAMFPGRPVDESADLLRGLRADIQQRN